MYKHRRCHCSSGRCVKCYDHRKYLLNRSKILRRSKARHLIDKYKLEDSNKLLDDFIAGRLSLHDFEVELNVN
jgi:hypothetical protein